MAKKKSYGRTASGKPITDELVEKLADKAEAGYDVEETLRRQRRVRPARAGVTRGTRRAGRARPRDDLGRDPQGATEVPPSRLTAAGAGGCVTPVPQSTLAPPMESDTLGDEPRVTAATQAPRDGHRAAASDGVLRRSSRPSVPWLAGVAERVEVDLAVSGLKPDWPPSAATARDRWYRAGGHCPLDRAAAVGVPVNGCSRRTPDVLQARRRTSVRTNQNRPANRAFSLERPMIGPRRVRTQSDPTQTNKPTGP